MSEGFAKVGSLNDFEAGSMRKIQLDGEDVLVANIAGRIYAIADTCTHRGCSLSEGTIEGTEVICPCHSAHFDLTTGKVTAPPAKKDVSSFVVQLQGSDVLVKRQ